MKNIGLKTNIIGVSKKIHFLDFQNDKLEIHFEGLEENTSDYQDLFYQPSTVKDVVDLLNITRGTDDDLSKSAEFENSEKANKLWRTGYEVWLHSIQIQANGKPLGFHLAFIKFRELRGIA